MKCHKIFFQMTNIGIMFLLLVGCKSLVSTPILPSPTITPVPPTPTPEEYRALTEADGLSCGARVASMEFIVAENGKTSLNGELEGFECLNQEGKTVELVLSSKKLTDGKIETKEFGTILMEMQGFNSATYYMTDSQIMKIKEFLGFTK